MAYERGRHTPGPRWCGLVVGLALAACSHPGPTPRAPEPDDERAGAIELVWSDETKNFTAEGALDASAGDIVDWYTLTLPAGVKSGFTVSVDGLGRERDRGEAIGLDRGGPPAGARTLRPGPAGSIAVRTRRPRPRPRP